MLKKINFNDRFDSHSKRNPDVFTFFDIHDEKKEGFSKFVELKLYSKFIKNKIGKFYKIFINQLRNLDDLNVLFELFPKEQLDTEFLKELLDKIPKLLDLGKNEDKNKLLENMFAIISSII